MGQARLLGPAEIRELAAELDVTPTKKLGQNFVVDANTVRAEHGWLGDYELHADGSPRIIFCDNETNEGAVFGHEFNRRELTKDGFDARIVHGDSEAIRLDYGTKVGFWYHFDDIGPGDARPRARPPLHGGDHLPGAFRRRRQRPG